ncbi:hypothetical protein KIN20_016267 [Parelaphostrongylus tenuis]|uniref:Uncharacterized protein n=1 Tax=Parelaphostrongylus tenuis TaxID=148309 RepID=A0AAD5MYB4_PARTN|nr:hypothetical protein KIN20_016267 [Parelaphostrongylus tenuis]
MVCGQSALPFFVHTQLPHEAEHRYHRNKSYVDIMRYRKKYARSIKYEVMPVGVLKVYVKGIRIALKKAEKEVENSRLR